MRGTKYCWLHYPKKSPVVSLIIGAALSYCIGLIPTATDKQIEEIYQLTKKYYPGLETADAISKLSKELQSVRSLAARHTYKPLDPALRLRTLDRIGQICSILNQSNVVVCISYEHWSSPSTRKFVEQLASLLEEAGITVSEPHVSNALPFVVGRAEDCPVEWGFNESLSEKVKILRSALSPIMSCKKSSWRPRKNDGKILIHFVGQAVFEPSGKVEIQ